MIKGAITMQKDHNRRGNQARTLSRAVLMTAALAATAHAQTPADKCEAGKNDAAGKYAACAAKAEKTFILKGDATKYADALTKCSEKYGSKWDKLEQNAGNACPSYNNETTVKDFMDSCLESVAEAVGGGSPPACAAGVLKTGETTSYGTASDGHLQKGIPRSFTDNGDGTVTDNATGLMWEKKSDDGSVHDYQFAGTWGMTTPPYTMNGNLPDLLDVLNNHCSIDEGTPCTSNADCTTPGDLCGFAGHRDWRIPNVSELLTLVNWGAANPATYPEFNSSCGVCSVLECSCTRASSIGYWSSTTVNNTPSTAMYVDFVDGFAYVAPKDANKEWRAVREAP